MYQNQVLLKTLQAPVHVQWDRYGIPHLKGDNQRDLYHALGFVVASERLFQMDIHRRLASGMLSEIFGEKTLKVDKLFRTFRFRAAMEEMLLQGRVQTQALDFLQAYLDGVNSYIEQGTLPYEFQLLGYKPAPFEILDALAFIGYMGFSFSPALKLEILLSKLSTKLPWELLRELRVDPSQGQGEVLPLVGDISLKSLRQTLAQVGRDYAPFEGSNAWVVGPSRSKSNFPLLASDPHINFSLPGTWFEAHIQYPDYEMYGHFLPLLPFPVLGHNNDYGWTFTISYVDDMDFYREKTKKLPDGQEVVLYAGEWVPLVIEKEVIKVKSAEDVAFVHRLTPHGPLLDEILEFKNIAVKWAFHHPENQILDALYLMGVSKKRQDFLQALRLGTAPGLNVIYANKQGDFGQWLFGLVPLRPNNVRADFVLDGGSGKDEYLGYMSFDQRPYEFNPHSGFVISANSEHRHGKEKIAGHYQYPERFETIEYLLSQQKQWDLEGLKSIQTASYGLSSKKFLPKLLKLLNHNAFETQELEILKTWNQNSDVNSSGASIFHSWLVEIQKMLLDELEQEDYYLYASTNNMRHFLYRTLDNLRSPWWDIKQTSKKEVPSEIVTMALRKALDNLKQLRGSDSQKWGWGHLHTLEFVHPLGRQRPLNLIFNRGPYAAPGAQGQINNLRRVGEEQAFLVKAGPSTRRLIDFRDPSVSWGVLPLGNSGHLFSPHYDDQVDLYLRGEYRLQLMKESLLKVQGGPLLILTNK